MSTGLLLISDGRADYLERTLASAAQNLPPMDVLVHVDDTDHEMGFGGAIQAGWEALLHAGCEWVFHLEADFTFNAPVPLEAMVALLHENPEIKQVSLKRQAWNESELAAGGVVETAPDDYTEHLWAGVKWTTNRRCFTTNPCVYSARLCALGWPEGRRSEGVFTHRLIGQDEGACFALWGAKYDPPMVEHIGTERTGLGY
jgi:hypothetical protein